MSLLAFILGFIAAGSAALWILLPMRARITSLQEDIDRASEESDIVLGFMHKIVGDVASGVDKETLYSKILRAVTLGCGATSAAIYEPFDESNLKLVASEGAFPPQRHVDALDNMESRTDLIEKILDGEILEIREGIIGEVASSREPLIIRNARTSPRIADHKDSALVTTSIIAVPLMFRDKFYGVLSIANPIGGSAFSDMDFSVARSIADQASLSIFNINSFNSLVEKSKLDYDLSVASSVQLYLLPSELPKVDGFEFAVKYIPQQKIGGDFYDAFRLPNGKIGIVIGDVSGKGIAAAIIMSQCQIRLRYIALAHESPSEALKELNRAMFSAMRSDMFVTMAYAVLDPRTGKLLIARAGHEKPMRYCSSTRKAYFLSSKGIAVGMVEPKVFDSVIADVEESIDAGDFWILYTDGITEAESPQGEEFSSERLRLVVEKSVGMNAEGMCEKITGEVFSFTKREKLIDDDYTLFTIKRVK